MIETSSVLERAPGLVAQVIQNLLETIEAGQIRQVLRDERATAVRAADNISIDETDVPF